MHLLIQQRSMISDASQNELVVGVQSVFRYWHIADADISKRFRLLHDSAIGARGGSREPGTGAGCIVLSAAWALWLRNVVLCSCSCSHSHTSTRHKDTGNVGQEWLAAAGAVLVPCGSWSSQADPKSF
jgi:hypothetical protein